MDVVGLHVKNGKDSVHADDSDINMVSVHSFWQYLQLLIILKILGGYSITWDGRREGENDRYSLRPP